MKQTGWLRREDAKGRASSDNGYCLMRYSGLWEGLVKPLFQTPKILLCISWHTEVVVKRWVANL